MINNVTLMGRLTADPELKTTPTGTTLTTVCIAVDRRYSAKDGEKQADFINCVAWRGTAEFITRYFKKGDTIGIIGEIQTRKYKDKDGNNRTAFEIVINQATFCGGKSTGNGENSDDGSPVTPPENATFTEINTNEDELPF